MKAKEIVWSGNISYGLHGHVGKIKLFYISKNKRCETVTLTCYLTYYLLESFNSVDEAKLKAQSILDDIVNELADNEQSEVK